MHYKALILDVDGTIVPFDKVAVPSPKVTEAINKASKYVHIGLATGRPYFMLPHIIEHLNLSGPSIVNGGAQVIDTQTKKVLWEQTIERPVIDEVAAIFARHNVELIINDRVDEYPYSQDMQAEHILDGFAQNLESSVVDTLIAEISHIPTIAVYKTSAFEPGKNDIHVSHVYATKQHGILKAAEILGIKTDEIIGVGDGYNDFPLMMACGLKVAMGNAVDDLKAIADFVAPSVTDDGVATVIEKFILNPRHPELDSGSTRDSETSSE